MTIFYSNYNHRTGCGVNSPWQEAPGLREFGHAAGTARGTEAWASPAAVLSGCYTLEVASTLA